MEKVCDMIDWRHLRDNNETYLSHLGFAIKVGIFFIVVGAVFVTHSVIPWIKIPKFLNLLSVSQRAKKWNDYTLERLFK